jgi:hypothetical protein
MSTIRVTETTHADGRIEAEVYRARISPNDDFSAETLGRALAYNRTAAILIAVAQARYARQRAK